MATITRVSSGHWKAIIRRPRFGVRLKTRVFDRWDDADAWGRKTEAAIQRGVWRDLGDANKITLREAVKQYKIAVGASHRGADVEESAWDVILAEPIGGHVLGSITRSEIVTLRDKWRDRDGYAIGTINKRLGMLHSLFAWASDALDMPALVNPVPASVKLKGANERARRVTDAEIAAVIDASSSTVLPSFIRLAVETAMRRGELCTITWEMLDLDTAVAHLPGAITKSAKARDVPLSPVAVDVLAGLARGRGTVLGVTPHAVTRAFERAVARARTRYVTGCEADGIEPDPRHLTDLHCHDLRHEATSRLAQLFALHELMKIVGHSSAKMLSRYYHPSAADFAVRMREAATPKQSARPAKTQKQSGKSRKRTSKT